MLHMCTSKLLGWNETVQQTQLNSWQTTWIQLLCFITCRWPSLQAVSWGSMQLRRKCDHSSRSHVACTQLLSLVDCQCKEGIRLWWHGTLVTSMVLLNPLLCTTADFVVHSMAYSNTYRLTNYLYLTLTQHSPGMHCMCNNPYDLCYLPTGRPKTVECDSVQG